MLIRVVAPHFVAGVTVDRDVITEAAPILHYTIGWGLDRLKNYCARKGWSMEIYD